MAYNTGYVAEQDQSLRSGPLLPRQEITVVTESPNAHGVPPNPLPKRPRTYSPPLFGSPVPNSVLDSSLVLGLETKKLIVATCRSIVKLESSLMKLDAKSSILEQHRSNGTLPKDLLLPKKKSLFEDEQPKVDAILLTASNALLSQRIAEISRKQSETLAHRNAVEADLLKTLESSRDSQLKLIAPEDEEKISIIKQRFSFNVSSFHSQLAISRENAFMKSKRAAEKEAAKKKADDTAMDTSADARVVDVLDQRLKQLGLIGKKSNSSSKKSRSRSSSSGSSISRSSSISVSASSRSPSRSSSRGSRGASSRGSQKLRRKKTSKKSVKFNPLVQHQEIPKNGGPTTPSHPRGRRRGRGKGNK